MNDVKADDALVFNFEMDNNGSVDCPNTLTGSADQAAGSFLSASMSVANVIVDDSFSAAVRYTINDVENGMGSSKQVKMDGKELKAAVSEKVEGSVCNMQDEPEMVEECETDNLCNEVNVKEDAKNGEENIEANSNQKGSNFSQMVKTRTNVEGTGDVVEEVFNVEDRSNEEIEEEEYKMGEEEEEEEEEEYDEDVEIELVSDEENIKEVKNAEDTRNETNPEKIANKLNERDKETLALLVTNEEVKNIEDTRNEADGIEAVSKKEITKDAKNTEETGKGTNIEENPEANTKKKVSKSRKRGNKRTRALRDTDEMVKEVKNEEETQNVAKGEEILDAKSTKKIGRLRKRGNGKKKASRFPNEVASKNMDNPESSNRSTRPKAKGTGMIFMCSAKTKKDCYRYKVLGLPASKRDLVLEIYEGMKLFLFDIDTKLMYGIYKAAGPGGYNLEPKAFNSAFPSQVRFTAVEECSPLSEKFFKKIIKDNYYSKSKFSCELTPEQVRNLCKLFRVSSKAPKPKGLVREPRAERPPRLVECEPKRPPRLVEREPKRPRRSSRPETRAFANRDSRRLHDNPRAEPEAYLHRDSSSRREAYEEERHPPPYSRNYVYPEDPIIYRRDTYAPPRPLPSTYALPPLPDSDVYRRERDPYLYHDQQPLVVVARRQDEFAQPDSYAMYREHPLYTRSYHDSLSPVGHRRAPEYYPPTSSRPAAEYRLSAGVASDYRPYRSVYRY